MPECGACGGTGRLDPIDIEDSPYMCGRCDGTGTPVPDEPEWNQRPEVGRHLDVLADALRAPTGRDEWVRAFNRLEAAVTHHKNAVGEDTWPHDDALYKARDKILSDLAAPSNTKEEQ